MITLDEDLRELSVADAALIHLRRRGWNVGDVGAATAEGRPVRLVVVTKEGRTIRAEGETGAAAWASALKQAGLDDDRNGEGRGR